MELICPAGTPSALHEAVAAGADAVYCGFRDETNARNFPGLNFSRQELRDAIQFAHARKTQVFVAINTFMRAGDEQIWYQAVDDAAALGADAVILADFGLMAYTAEKHPAQRLHVSVQASASNADAIGFLVDAFNAKRVVLPRVLTIPDIARLGRKIDCEMEVFVFGGLCVMAEGRCSLSSYATGRSPNMNGVCSPASHVRYRQDGSELVSELGDYTINRFPMVSRRVTLPSARAGSILATSRDMLSRTPFHSMSWTIWTSCEPPAFPRSRSKVGNAARPMSVKSFPHCARRWPPAPRSGPPCSPVSVC